MDPLLIGFGLLVGTLIGLTGVGGGSLMTPLLLLAGFSPVIAIGTDLLYGAVTKTLGGWRHLRAGHVDVRLSRWLAFGSVPGALCGVVAIDLLEGAYGEDFLPYLLTAVAVALLLAGGGTLFRALFRPGLSAKERDSALLEHRVSRIGTVLIGFVLGFVLGLTSVGSGALVGLALIMLYKLKPRRVVGTDVFHAAVLLWVAGLAHLATGNVDLGLMGTLLVGSLPGVLLGTALVPKVPVHGLRCALGVILVAAALGVATKADIPIPTAVLAAVPVVLGTACYLIDRRRRQRGAERALSLPGVMEPTT